MGVSLNEFWHLTPHSLSLIADGYIMTFQRQVEYDNTIAFLQGSYFVEALLATVGNMFSEKSSNKFEYPSKPYELNLDMLSSKNKNIEEDRNTNRDRNTDSETERQLKLFAAQLTTAMNNFNIQKSQDNKGK